MISLKFLLVITMLYKILLLLKTKRDKMIFMYLGRVVMILRVVGGMEGEKFCKGDSLQRVKAVCR